jgi:hypothetical protein
MRHLRAWCRASLTAYLITCVMAMGVMAALPVQAGAMLLPSVTSPETALPVQRIQDLEGIQSHLETRLVAQRLADLGLSTGEVQTRLVGLSDGEIHQLAQHLDSLHLGGDSVVVALVVVGAILLFFALFGFIHMMAQSD